MRLRRGAGLAASCRYRSRGARRRGEAAQPLATPRRPRQTTRTAARGIVDRQDRTREPKRRPHLDPYLPHGLQRQRPEIPADRVAIFLDQWPRREANLRRLTARSREVRGRERAAGEHQLCDRDGLLCGFRRPAVRRPLADQPVILDVGSSGAPGAEFVIPTVNVPAACFDGLWSLSDGLRFDIARSSFGLNQAATG